MRVELRGLCVDHADGSRALSYLDLVVPSGQVCAVMGPSGSGKTSLLRMLGGHLRASAGELRIDDAVLTGAGQKAVVRARKALAVRIGQIYQDHRLVVQASAAENMAHGAAAVLPHWRMMLGLYPDWLRDRCLTLAAGLQLDEEALARPASALSGGQQQRLGIARTLMLPRGLILADEPVSSLDPTMAAQTLGFLKEQAKAMGATVICSLHQPELAQRFADRIIVLDAGRITADGQPPAPLRACAA